jgi:hypothetical protein
MGNSVILDKLSSVVLIRKCLQCGITFETYDKTKLFHSNPCKQAYGKKHYDAFLVNRRKQRKERD